MHAFCEAEKSIATSSIPITLVIILKFPLGRVIFCVSSKSEAPGSGLASQKRSLGEIWGYLNSFLMRVLLANARKAQNEQLAAWYAMVDIGDWGPHGQAGPPVLTTVLSKSDLGLACSLVSAWQALPHFWSPTGTCERTRQVWVTPFNFHNYLFSPCFNMWFCPLIL